MLNLTQRLKEFARYESGIDHIVHIHPSEIVGQYRDRKIFEGIKSTYDAILQSAYFALWQMFNLAEIGTVGYIIPTALYKGDYKQVVLGASLIALLEFTKHFSSRPLWRIFRSNPYGPLRVPSMPYSEKV